MSKDCKIVQRQRWILSPGKRRLWPDYSVSSSTPKQPSYYRKTIVSSWYSDSLHPTWLEMGEITRFACLGFADVCSRIRFEGVLEPATPAELDILPSHLWHLPVAPNLPGSPIQHLPGNYPRIHKWIDLSPRGVSEVMGVSPVLIQSSSMT